MGEEAPNEETAVASCPTNVVVPGDLPELSKVEADSRIMNGATEHCSRM